MSEESSSDEEEEDYEELTFNTNLQMIGENDPLATRLEGRGSYERVQNMTDEDWEQLGCDMYVQHPSLGSGTICLSEGALNDHKMRFFFLGLTGSKTIKYGFIQEWIERSRNSEHGTILTDRQPSAVVPR